MPSNARRAFESNSKDVEKLLDIHAQLTGTGRGRRYEVEVLNKSAVVLITSFWEAYCEDIAAEALAHMVANCASPDSLPAELRKNVAKELQAEKHDLAVWRLSGDGWRNVVGGRLASMQQKRNKRLNTPKSEQIDDLFKKSVGLTRVSSSWSWPGMSADQARLKLDKYVTLRGAIAHRGSASDSVKKLEVTDYFEQVKKLVGKSGGRVNTAVKGLQVHRFGSTVEWRGQSQLLIYTHPRVMPEAGSKAQYALNRQFRGGRYAYYDTHRARGRTHHQALRALANRLVGILHGCLRHRILPTGEFAEPEHAITVRHEYPSLKIK